MVQFVACKEDWQEVEMWRLPWRDNYPGKVGDGAFQNGLKAVTCTVGSIHGIVF